MDSQRTIDQVLESMQDISKDTNAAKVTIGWETSDNGYLEFTYYSKKPIRK